MEVLKLLYEQPEKLRLLIVNLIKLLLTVGIVEKTLHQPQFKNLNEIIANNNVVHLDNILLYSTILIVTWFIVWYIGDAVFLLLLSIKTHKTNEIKDIQKKSFLTILKISGAFKIENKAYLPGRNILAISELAQSLRAKHQQMKSTLFAEALFISLVGLVYVWFNSKVFNIPFWTIIIILSILVILVIVYLSMDSLLSAFHDSSGSIMVFLNMMVYKEMVSGVLKNTFNAKYNTEKQCFELEWKSVLYEIGDVGFQNNEQGNSHLINHISDIKMNEINNGILITNVKPNANLRKLIEEGKLSAYVIAEKESDVINNLTIALEKLNSKVKGHLEKMLNT